MKLFTKILSTILLTMVLSAFAFAGSENNLKDANFPGSADSQMELAANTLAVPYFVMDGNFRWWQPPQPVPMIPSYQVQDIAWTNGYVIFYNPQLMLQVPLKVRAFTIAHEYGHIYQRTSNENASDAFAARVYSQTDRSVCQAVVWWMTNFPNNGDLTHPPSSIRARNIARECGV